MTSDRAEPVVVIVAAVDGGADLTACLRAFLDEVHGRGRVLLVDGTSDGTASATARAFDEVEVLRSRPGSLAPKLWRDGIRSSSEPVFVLTTSQMTPMDGWLESMLCRLTETAAASVGGPIEADLAGLGPCDSAVYLLRYLNYRRPLGATQSLQPPGDNALYRRDVVEGLADAIERGFWEAEVNRMLVAQGERLIFEPGAVVIFRGESLFRCLLRRRFLHAWYYASGRAQFFGVGKKIGRTVLAPAVPGLMLGRIVTAMVQKGLRPSAMLPALPWLVSLLAAWTLGETLGTWLEPPGSRSFAGPVARPLVEVQG
jgi:hypothetical protein